MKKSFIYKNSHNHFQPSWKLDSTSLSMLNQCERIKKRILEMINIVDGEPAIVVETLSDGLKSIEQAIVFLKKYKDVNVTVPMEYMLFASQSIGRAEAMDLAINSMLENMDDIAIECADIIKKKVNNLRSEFAKKGAEIRHNAPGGSREKIRLIREIWASGKYRTREICAEEEYDALKWTYSSARRALRNTPDPS